VITAQQLFAREALEAQAAAITAACQRRLGKASTSGAFSSLERSEGVEGLDQDHSPFA
jgi:hypothetical protein